MRSNKHFLSLFICLLLALPLLSQGPQAYHPEPQFKKVELQTFHLKMRDGVQIAIDLLLPKDRQAGQKFPTILHQTRYWRALDLRWPFQGFIDEGAPSLWVIASTNQLVQQGYAIVSVDARGTGASTGSRQIEASEDEIQDGWEIMDWIVDQSWSDGNIGTIGVSYNGWIALMTAALGHPALKCVVPISAPFDGYREMTMPGGVYNQYMIDDWTSICDRMDHDVIPTRLKAKWLYLKGISLVEKGRRKKQLEALYAEREQNAYADDFMERIKYRDATVPELGATTIDSIFPAGNFQKINAAGVPIYAIAGWFDISAAAGATRMLMNSDHPDSKLLIGAWHHGSRKRVSPFNEVVPIEFDRYGEILKFFDHHLKGKNTGIQEEAQTHYYHMGAEEWRASQSWPLRETRKQILYLGDQYRLEIAPPESEARDACTLDNDLYFGIDSRWELGGGNRARYDTFLTYEADLLQYTSAPYEQTVDVTGFPVMNLYMQLPTEKANVFVFLEDVAPDGSVRVVSQGQVQAGFRKLHAGHTPYADAMPYRRMFKEDYQSVDPEGVTELPVLFQPTSWRIEAGHAVRVVICGSDRPQFRAPDAPAYAAQLIRSRLHASRLELPVQMNALMGREK